jgi:hypothetical protein
MNIFNNFISQIMANKCVESPTYVTVYGIQDRNRGMSEQEDGRILGTIIRGYSQRHGKNENLAGVRRRGLERRENDRSKRNLTQFQEPTPVP